MILSTCVNGTTGSTTYSLFLWEFQATRVSLLTRGREKEQAEIEYSF